MVSKEIWAKNMRHAIKLENGDGWSVRGREVRGIRKTQVTYRYQDGLGMKNPRSAVFLPYEWTVRNQSKITTAVAGLKRLLEERNLKSLKEAESFRLGRDEHDQSEGIQG
jgi:mRNA degradation ribonuclease J1/J2